MDRLLASVQILLRPAGCSRADDLFRSPEQAGVVLDLFVRRARLDRICGCCYERLRGLWARVRCAFHSLDIGPPHHMASFLHSGAVCDRTGFRTDREKARSPVRWAPTDLERRLAETRPLSEHTAIAAAAIQAPRAVSTAKSGGDAARRQVPGSATVPNADGACVTAAVSARSARSRGPSSAACGAVAK